MPESNDSEESSVKPIPRWVYPVMIAGVATLIVLRVFGDRIEDARSRRRNVNTLNRSYGWEKDIATLFLDQGVHMNELRDILPENASTNLVTLLKNDPEVTSLNLGVGNSMRSRPVTNETRYAQFLAHNLGLYTMYACDSYGINLEDAVEMPSYPIRYTVDQLQEANVPSEYALPRIKRQEPVEEILEAYAQEVCGCSAETREKYRSVGRKSMYHDAIIDDNKIKMAVSVDLDPNQLKEAIGAESVEAVFPLVQADKLTGANWEQWRSTFGPKDAFQGIALDYDFQTLKRAHDIHGWTVRDFSNELAEYRSLQAADRQLQQNK